ncbi:MAG TPA: ferritin-like domain-containing protein [Acidimicrobiales bacterium]|nr:ferritin-like domain-containing protein [Acidimicrobiales bacterium]
MPLDERALGELVEQSQDLHTDAMRATADELDQLVELGRERRASDGFDPEESRLGVEATREGIRKGLVAGGAVAATAFGAALMAMAASPAFADSATDVQVLQTAASLENLAVNTYKTALTLPYIGGSSANPVIKAFATTTMGQHAQHAQAFNSAVTALGGKAQNNPDPKYVPVVDNAVSAITKDSPSAGALAVVNLAMTLENVAAETYVANCSLLSDQNAKKITASIMGVEAQHVAVLNAVKALLSANAPQLITLSPTVAAQLPAAAGSVGFPNSFYPTSSASPASEGAVA